MAKTADVKAVTKTVFVEKLVEKVDGLTKNKADEVFDAVWSVIRETLAADGEVSVVGFGSFSKRMTTPRKGTMKFANGEPISYETPSHPAVKFKASKVLLGQIGVYEKGKRV